MSPRAPGRHVAAPARGRTVVCTCINRMRAPRCRSGRGLCTLPPFGAPVETSTAAITANPSNPGGAGSEPLRGFWPHMTGSRSPSACAGSLPRGRCTLLCWSRVSHSRASPHAVARGFRPWTTFPSENGVGRGSSPRPIRAGLRSARIRGSNRGRRPFATPDRYVHMQLCIPHFRTSIPGLARSELAPVDCMIEARGAPRGRTSIDNSPFSARCVRQ